MPPAANESAFFVLEHRHPFWACGPPECKMKSEKRKYKHYKVWLNGKVILPEEANVSVFTQTALRGANVYEGVRAYWSDPNENLYVWKLTPHLARLFQNMKIMRMTPPFSREELQEAVLDWIRQNAFREDIHFRVVSYFGDGGAGGVKAYRPDEIDFGSFIAGGPREHKEDIENGLHLCVSSWRRISDDATPPRVKAGANYQNSRLAAIEARENGYDDAIILNQAGKVAEATGANVIIIREGVAVTPPVTEGILEGITRRTLLGMLHSHLKRSIVERPIDRTELYIADEIFLCGSAMEVTSVISVDRISVGDGKPGPITSQLQGVFFNAARGFDEAFQEDLLAVY